MRARNWVRGRVSTRPAAHTSGCWPGAPRPRSSVIQIAELDGLRRARCWQALTTSPSWISGMVSPLRCTKRFSRVRRSSLPECAECSRCISPSRRGSAPSTSGFELHLAQLRHVAVVGEEVEAAHLVRAVVRAVPGAYAPVVGHLVDALGAVRGRGHRAHQLTRGVLALLAADGCMTACGSSGSSPM